MQKKETILLLIGGILQFCSFATDILYISMEEFCTTLTFIMCLVFLIIPTAILIIIFGISLLIQRSSIPKEEYLKNLKFMTSIMLGDQSGICSIVYSIIYLKEKVEKERPTEYFICKLASILIAFFESVPQLIIQTYNSGELKSSSTILIVSCIFSGIQIIFSVCRLVKTYDKHLKVQSTVEMIKKTTNISTESRNNEITLEDIEQ